MTEELIHAGISDTQAKLDALTKNHEATIARFNLQLAQNRDEYHRLQGRLDVYQALAPQPSPDPPTDA